MCGLAKKVLLANNIGALWEIYKTMDPSSLSVLGAWLGVLAFAFQIYFDFSGYSDMEMCIRDRPGRVHGEDRRRSRDPGHVIFLRESGNSHFFDTLNPPKALPLGDFFIVCSIFS